jgi:hypothetical protein
MTGGLNRTDRLDLTKCQDCKVICAMVPALNNVLVVMVFARVWCDGPREFSL